MSCRLKLKPVLLSRKARSAITVFLSAAPVRRSEVRAVALATHANGAREIGHLLVKHNQVGHAPTISKFWTQSQ